MKPHPECPNLDTTQHVPNVAALFIDDGEHPVPDWHLPIQRCDECASRYERAGQPFFEGDLDAAIAVASARGFSLIGIPSPSGQPYIVQQPWESLREEMKEFE